MKSDYQEKLTIDDTQKIFNNYFKNDIGYNASEVNAVIGYFLKKGFDTIAATNTAAIFLQQARIDKIPVFKLIDTLKGLNDIEIDNVISQILNLYRSKTSSIGFKKNTILSLVEQRNIII